MSKITRFQDLECWQLARQLVKLVYLACREGDLQKDFGLQRQIREAAVSVMNNTAEGFGRWSDKEKLHFYDYAKTSCMEVESMTYVLEDMHMVRPETWLAIREQCDPARRSVLGLIAYTVQHPRAAK